MKKKREIIFLPQEPKTMSFKKTIRYTLGGLTDDQRQILNETGFWVCGNPKCINPKPKRSDKPRTKLAKINAVGHSTLLRGEDQPIEIEFQSLHNRCRRCGHDNWITIETETETEEIKKY